MLTNIIHYFGTRSLRLGEICKKFDKFDRLFFEKVGLRGDI